MKYHIVTFGCQMNHSDSEKIESFLKLRGDKPAKNETEANLIVINCCSVRQSAMNRVYDRLNKAKSKKVILAGCIIEADRKKYENTVEIWRPNKYFNCTPILKNPRSAYVPIMTGCNNFCAYCVVPYTRGREKSRPAGEIIAEVKSLVKKGYKKLILLGQNVNSYQNTSLRGIPQRGMTKQSRDCFAYARNDKIIDFSVLLKMINAIPGNFWLSFLTSHPKDMSDELIETIARCQKVLPYIHLPVQAGNNEVLKQMNRHYTVIHYKNLIKKIRSAFARHRRASADKSAFSPLAISTDIIVGFPGETKKQFQDTLKLVREIKFDMIYFAQYSPRPGTAAYKLKDDVSIREKKRRAMALNEALKKTALQNNKKYIGRTTEVLIEEIKKGSAFGKTNTGKTVKIESEKSKPGDLIKVKIVGATTWGLRGKAD